jgi:hypothetical protein
MHGGKMYKNAHIMDDKKKSYKAYKNYPRVPFKTGLVQ